MKKRGFLIYLIILGFVFIPKMVFAETITGVATIGRGAVMDTSNVYTYTDYKTLSSDSINALPINAFTSATDFYIMGAEYSYAISLTGQTNFAATVRVPVATDTIYTYTLTDGLNQNDFKVGISPNFSVYNITPNITSFGKVQGVYSRNGVAHTYIYYDVVFNFVLEQPLTGSYNLNFAMLNTTGNRSTYFYSGGSPGTTFEFPVSYNTGQTTPDAVLFSSMSPSVSLSTGTTSNNQDIIDANNENTQLIISNQNENTEALQETIEQSYENLVNSQEVCTIYDKNNIILDNTFLGYGGNLLSSNNYGVTDFINVSNSTVSVIDSWSSNDAQLCFYNFSKSQISCSNLSDISTGTLSFPDNTTYIRFSIRKDSNKPKISLCKNGNQAISNQLDGILDQSTDGIDFTFGDIDVISDTPVSDLLLLPLELITQLTTALGSNCMTWDLPFNLWGNGNYVLHMPCIQPENYFGSTVWTVIDDMFCIFMIYNIFKMLLRFFESWSSLNDTFDDVVGGVK